MLYEKFRELTRLSVQRWLNEEVFSFGWFLMVAVLIAAYAVWLKLLDRRRATELLLIGSLAAVAKSLNSMIIGSLLGLANYTIRLLPFQSNVFISSITIAPIIVMLAEQYTRSWKGYMVRTAIGIGVLCLIIFSIYDYVGIVEFHNWNVFYHFVVLFVIAQAVRLTFLWITGTQKRYTLRPENRTHPS